MEECFDNLDISYEATEPANKVQQLGSDSLSDPAKSNENIANSNQKTNLSSSSAKALDQCQTVTPTTTMGTTTNIDEYFSEDADLFSMLFNKDSSEVDLFLNTLNSFAQNKNKLIELLRSLSTIKTESSNSYDSLLGNDSLKLSLKEATSKQETESSELGQVTPQVQWTESAGDNAIQEASVPELPEPLLDEDHQQQQEEQQQVANEPIQDIEWADHVPDNSDSLAKPDPEPVPDSQSNPTVASTLSAILQRCQSSLDSALVHQIDAAMLQELEDEEEELMRNATIPENETDENLEDEFMEEDDFVAAATEKTLSQHHHHPHQDVNNNSLAFERGLQRMRELNKRSVGSTGSSNQSGQDSHTTFSHQHHHQNQSQYNDEFVLKCQFSALIPAFDPRPGKNNINQIQDISVPPTTAATVANTTTDPNAQQQQQQTDASSAANSAQKQTGSDGNSKVVDLFLKVEYTTASSSTENGLEFVKEEIKLTNKNATIFQYIQNLISLKDQCPCATDKQKQNKMLHFEKMKNIWDVNYTLIYREAATTTGENTSKDDSIVSDASLSIPENQETMCTVESQPQLCNVEQVLQLLTTLSHVISHASDDKRTEFEPLPMIDVKKEFISEKINNKLIQQLQDPLVLASRSLPDWCKNLLHSYKFLFPFETRQLYFQTTAFGVSRSIVWLQNKRETLLNQLRGPVTNRVMRDDHEFRIGRLKHERIKIPRDPAATLLRAAINALKFHATRKAILEIEFIDEEGTGLGPTLEFFSLIATELQRKTLALWHCEDNPELSDNKDLFAHSTNGLFPIAYPPVESMAENSKEAYEQHYNSVLELFNFLGIFLAKSLQDQRLVDLPFSHSFLKVLCAFKDKKQPTFANRVKITDSQEATLDSESGTKIDLEMLTLNDLAMIDPVRGSLLIQISSLLEKRKLSGDESTDDLVLQINGHSVNLEDLALTFEYNPPSKVYGYHSYNLKEKGHDILVCRENAEEYVSLMSRFILNGGIEKQLQAFKGSILLCF